ncbi:PREDICTED: zinc finger protein 600-like [Priapulus caudatus]|uniref:Zinc finger protein 600-like n=1 Tax=Priapulus caudatus TaxID=37621 RepID=A0ABM1E341_PRICU|nr:PREDICTED: zinc finger protein 600-like [Priapulus caudatus]
MGKAKKKKKGAAGYTCGECDAKFAHRSELLRHLTQHRTIPHGAHRCTTCQRRFTSPAQLGRHCCMRVEGQFDCVYCGETFRTQPLRAVHVAGEHAGDVAGVVTCVTCEVVFRTHEQTNAHYNIAHMSKCPVLRCNKCEFKTGNMSELKQHKCEKQKKSPQKKALAQSSKSVTKSSTTAADTKQSTSTTAAPGGASNAPRSRKRAAPTTQFAYMCGECDLTFEIRAELVAHLAKHRGGQSLLASNHKCSTCHRKFSHALNLGKHVCIDMEGCFDCIYCGERFTLQKERAQHIMDDHVESDFVKCTVCRCNFKDLMQLQSHTDKLHSSRSALTQCLRCHYQSNDVSAIKYHRCDDTIAAGAGGDNNRNAGSSSGKSSKTRKTTRKRKHSSESDSGDDSHDSDDDSGDSSDSHGSDYVMPRNRKKKMQAQAQSAGTRRSQRKSSS